MFLDVRTGGVSGRSDKAFNLGVNGPKTPTAAIPSTKQLSPSIRIRCIWTRFSRSVAVVVSGVTSARPGCGSRSRWAWRRAVSSVLGSLGRRWRIAGRIYVRVHRAAGPDRVAGQHLSQADSSPSSFALIFSNSKWSRNSQGGARPRRRDGLRHTIEAS